MKVSCLKYRSIKEIVFQFECDRMFSKSSSCSEDRGCNVSYMLEHCGRRRTFLFRVRLYSRTVVNWRRAKYYFKIAEMYKT